MPGRLASYWPKTRDILRAGPEAVRENRTAFQIAPHELLTTQEAIWPRPALLEQVLVGERLAVLPRAVAVAEVDALAERRVIGAQQLEQPVRARVGQVVLLQLHERGRRRVVVAGDLEAEPVGFVLGVAAVRQRERRRNEE